MGGVKEAALPMNPVGELNSEYGAVDAAACPKMVVALGSVKCGGKLERGSSAESGRRGRMPGRRRGSGVRLMGRALVAVCLS